MQISSRERSFHYSAFGLTIESDFCLPELFELSDSGISDVRITRVSAVDAPAIPNDSFSFDRPGCTVNVSPGFVSYVWTDIGRVVVRNGKEVTVNRAPGAADEDLAPFLTGAVLGNLLEQRGKMVLHGSAVSIDGVGVAFLGEKGAGKSTLALYLEKHGCPLLTDDLLPVTVVGDQVQMIPGPGQIKVWPDSAVSAGLTLEAMPKISKFADKRSYRCSTGGSDRPVKVDRIYILTEEPKIRIRRIDLPAAFIELTRHAYISRYLQATGRYADHFKEGSAIVRTIPIFRLGRPHDFNCLPSVSSALMNHVNTSADRVF